MFNIYHWIMFIQVVLLEELKKGWTLRCHLLSFYNEGLFSGEI